MCLHHQEVAAAFFFSSTPTMTSTLTLTPTLTTTSSSSSSSSSSSAAAQAAAQKKCVITPEQRTAIESLSLTQLSKALARANEADGEIAFRFGSNKLKMAAYICRYELAVKFALEEYTKRSVNRVMCTGIKTKVVKDKVVTERCGRAVGWGKPEEFAVKLCTPCQDAKDGKEEKKEKKEKKETKKRKKEEEASVVVVEDDAESASASKRAATSQSSSSSSSSSASVASKPCTATGCLLPAVYGKTETSEWIFCAPHFRNWATEQFLMAFKGSK